VILSFEEAYCIEIVSRQFSDVVLLTFVTWVHSERDWKVCLTYILSLFAQLLYNCHLGLAQQS